MRSTMAAVLSSTATRYDVTNVCLVINAQGFKVTSYEPKPLVLKEMAITGTTWSELYTTVYRFLSPEPKSSLTKEDKISIEREQLKNHLLYEDSKIQDGDLHVRAACSIIHGHYMMSKREGKICIGYADDFTEKLLQGELALQAREHEMLADIPRIDLRNEDIPTVDTMSNLHKLYGLEKMKLEPCSLHVRFDNARINCSGVNSLIQATYVKNVSEIENLSSCLNKMMSSKQVRFQDSQL